MIAETVCSAVSAAGLGIAAITAYRRRFLRAARIAAYALVPIGLVMTGAVEWAADTAFSPTAWAGFGVLGAAWLLFLVTRAVERRGGGTRKERKERRAAEGAGREAVAPAVSAPALPNDSRTGYAGRTGKGTGAGTRPASASRATEPADDFSEIEAILKKHGI
ncbi:hypothetical protein GCM10010145_31040 [Streptomyces ruber]|uniref:Uncharacterized protein n=2 Tax=Streptomyces TaxID=1883 RepID=A0A918EQY8_9ACTN|nr:hypothetical protein [Streptomyces ruber]GGQ58671.1 hypothetical protein GCM10010145_31040 [Streptomyces ruber]